MENLVSIITPNFNSSKYIKQTIDSVLNQTHQNWEWIIVDDNSSDDSTKIITTYKQDKRITLFCLEKNSGAAIARNKALELAKGRYITFIDSDDLWLPNFLQETINYLTTNNVELVYTSYKRYDEDLNPYLEDFTGPDKVNYNRLLYNCPIPMLTAIYDSKRIGKIKIPFVDKREDYAMWLNVLKKTPYAYCIKKPLAIYRIRKGSYSRNKLLMGIKQFNVYYKFLNFNLVKSFYYTYFWAINGLLKYVKL